MGGPDDTDDENAWRAWWNDRLGYSYSPPQKVPVVLAGSVEAPPSAIGALPPIPVHTNCFPAGTPVRTISGDKPIETLRVGDKVLSQDTRTGTLAFQPVLVVHDNGPAPTLRLEFEGGETIVASMFHRFWRAGRGWAMSRDLAPGDVIRTLGGCATLSSVSKDAVLRVYNLDVDEYRTYFVGHSALLVHDNRLPELRVKPFDAAPDLVSRAVGNTATSSR